MTIDIKTDDLEWSHSALAIGFVILSLGQNWSIFTWKNFLTQKFSKFALFWAIAVICNLSGSNVALQMTYYVLANCGAKCQCTCFDYSSAREPLNEPKFFLKLLTSYSHVFNTEARIFDHFLNFPNRATVHIKNTKPM